MDTTVFLAVIAAAVLHAVWNALVKGGSDKHLAMAGVVLGHVPICLLLLPFVPAPDPAAYPFMAAAVCLHVGYQFFLLQSYRFGDLTQVYPIARGSAPLLVAAVSVLFLGVTLATGEWAGILVIGLGVMSLGLVKRREASHDNRAALLALATGCFIAAYSLVDGNGARIAGTALGYYVWVALGNAFVSTLIILATMPGLIRALPTRGRRAFLIGGNASFVAYALVTWAFTQAEIPLVTALRETSIVFALGIGMVFLNEKIDLKRVAATMLTLAGAVMLRLAKP